MSATPSSDPVFAIQRVYLKGLSLEIPHAPQIFLEPTQPGVEVQIDIANQQLADGIHEVTVEVTVTTRLADKVAFLVEVQQAGIFELRNLDPQQMVPILNIVCPSIVFPYLRSNVADTIQRSGFPPIHLAEINFEALYHQRQQAIDAQAQTSPS